MESIKKGRVLRDTLYGRVRIGTAVLKTPAGTQPGAAASSSTGLPAVTKQELVVVIKVSPNERRAAVARLYESHLLTIPCVRDCRNTKKHSSRRSKLAMGIPCTRMRRMSCDYTRCSVESHVRISFDCTTYEQMPLITTLFSNTLRKANFSPSSPIPISLAITHDISSDN